MEQSTDYHMLSPRHRSERETRPSLAPTVWLGLSQDTKSSNLLGQPPESRKHALPSPDADVGVLDRLDRPFKLPQYPPPSYSQTRETTFSFSDTQRTELAPIKSMGNVDGNGGHQGNDKLPSLSSITSPTPMSPSPSTQHYESSSSSLQRPPEAPPPLTHWPSLNPLTAYYTPSHVQNPEPPMRMEVDPSPSSRNGVSPSSASPDRFQSGRSSSVSLDDPDVRMAAEALGSLRADFVSSPRRKQSPPVSPQTFTVGQQPEPLLSLLTTSHPFLATTIDSATSAYESSKNYSSRIKTSIEYVEGYVIPIANTVGSVGRKTGVENGVRWFLRRRSRPRSEIEGDRQGSSKRRKFGPGDDCHTSATPESDPGAQTPRASMETLRDRQLSIGSTVDTLPAYDEFRSPPYAEQLTGPDDRPDSVTWHSRLIMSTSGLSIAMSEESLRRLKYCLSWIRWANVHIGNTVNSLTITMEKYERKTNDNTGDSHMQDSSLLHETEDRSQLAAKVGLLRSDVVKTLRDVTDTVSRYAGGALPENARALVRRHLTSLPQRLHLANIANNRESRENREADSHSDVNMEEGRSEQEQEQETDKKTRESAQLVLVIAKEGLEMMSQVSGILNGTIESAEEWCERLGKKKREKREDMLGVPQALPEVLFGDTKTG